MTISNALYSIEGREDEAISSVHEILENCSLPIIVDADGLWAVQQNLSLLVGKENVILTPNIPEFKRLVEAARDQNILDEAGCTISELSLALNCTILLKGAQDKVCKGLTIQLIGRMIS